MKIAFWSNVHGQTTTTSNTLAVSIMMSLLHQYKILLTHNHYHHSTLEYTLLGGKLMNQDLIEFDDMGIDAVSRFIKYDVVDEGCIQNYATTIIKNRLDFLTGTRQVNEDFYYRDLNDVIEMILDSAKSVYNLLLIDVAAGENEVTNKILLSSDLVVVNLNQNSYVLEDFFEKHYKNLDNILLLLSMYDRQSKYNIKMIKQRYGIKDPITYIPYCRNYADAMNQGKAIDFIARNLKVDKHDGNYHFIHQVKTTTSLILQNFEESLGLREIS